MPSLDAFHELLGPLPSSRPRACEYCEAALSPKAIDSKGRCRNCGAPPERYSFAGLSSVEHPDPIPIVFGSRPPKPVPPPAEDDFGRPLRRRTGALRRSVIPAGEVFVPMPIRLQGTTFER